MHRALPKVMRAVTPHSPAHRPSPSDSMESDYLKAEVKYIGQGGIESNEVEQVLQSREAFSNALQDLDDKGVRNLEAQDMTRHVRTVMLQALGENMTVHSLSCGLSICMGSVQSGSAFDDIWAHPLPGSWGDQGLRVCRSDRSEGRSSRAPVSVFYGP